MLPKYVIKYQKGIDIAFIAFGVVSVIAGFYNLVTLGCDCQIEGSNYLLARKSPYSLYLEDSSVFRFSRFPTHFPQSYYALLPLAVLGDYWGYIVYGMISISLLLSIGIFYKQNQRLLILVFALFATTPFRNNLGNGQYLCIFFSLFIIYDYLVTTSKSKAILFIVCPFILLFLAGKPTTFFWIPFFYPFNKKAGLIYTLTLLLQIATIYFFGLHTNSSVTTFISEYRAIAALPANLMFTNSSVFSIIFDHWLDVIKSVLVFLNGALVLTFFYLKFGRTVTLSRSCWLFTCIVLSFIVVYHNNYDSFLLLAPLFVANHNPFAKENLPIVWLFVYMIFEKAIFLLFSTTLAPAINNLLVVLLTLLIQINFLKENLRLRFAGKALAFKPAFH